MPKSSRGTRGLLRRFAVGSGPLKRGSDRLQQLAHVLLLMTVLTAIPVVLAVFTATLSRADGVAAAEAASRHEARATLLANAGPRARTTTDSSGVPQSTVAWIGTATGSPGVPQSTVAWTGPSGRKHQARMAVPIGALAGSTITIWIDARGLVTSPPTTHGDRVQAAFSVAFLTFLGISLSAVVVYLPFRSLLNRSRLRRWGAAWAVIEPMWTRKVS